MVHCNMLPQFLISSYSVVFQRHAHTHMHTDADKNNILVCHFACIQGTEIHVCFQGDLIKMLVLCRSCKRFKSHPDIS